MTLLYIRKTALLLVFSLDHNGSRPLPEEGRRMICFSSQDSWPIMPFPEELRSNVEDFYWPT